MSKESDYCPECGALKDWDMLTEGKHDLDLCEGRQLRKARIEIKKLKASIDSWKDAWYQLREIIKRLWFNHPALDTEEEYQHYKKLHDKFKESRSRGDTTTIGCNLSCSRSSTHQSRHRHIRSIRKWIQSKFDRRNNPSTLD